MALFSVAEARAYDKGQLTSATQYPSAVIETAEAAIRARFERIIGVALQPTEVVEYHDGDGTDTILLFHHNPWSVSAPSPVTVKSISIVYSDGSTESVSTATDVTVYPHKIVHKWRTWPVGNRNIVVTYTHGHVTVPADIKAAAMQALLLPPPDGLIPSTAPSTAYEGTEGQIRWSRVKDPDRGRWFGHEAIDAVLREHRRLEMVPLVR